MSKKGRRQNRNRRRNSTLSAHKQTRKRLSPPLMSLPGGGPTFTSWERDQLPDYLLMSAYLVDRPVEDVHRLHALLNLIDRARDQTHEDKAATAADSQEAPESGTDGSEEDAESGPPKDIFTGRLTEFEEFTPAERVSTLDLLLNRGEYEELIPEPVFHMLGMYRNGPGTWLLQPWRDRGLAVGPEVAERTLGRVLVEAGPHQDPIATRTKALACNRWGAAGRLQVPGFMAREFNGWPYAEEQEDMNKKVEATYRATFGALANVGTDGVDATLAWAKRFWQANWHLYSCRWPDDPPYTTSVPPKEREDTDAHRDEAGAPGVATELDPTTDAAEEPAEVEIDQPAHEPGEDPPTTEAKAPQGGDSEEDVLAFWRRTMDDARNSVDAIVEDFTKLADTTDPDLYNPDRYEVLTGIVGRTLRYLDVFIGYPPLWTMEQGAPVLRALVEARIVLRFLNRRDDPELFAKFKAYGMGKLKLLKLHFENLIDSQAEPAEDLVEYVAYLDALVNQDVMEEFQEIDVGGSFAGIDTRRMAAEADLQQDYRLVFAPASSNVHGEWSIIDEYVFVRCRNPAHRRHRILRRDRDDTTGPMFLQTLFGYADLLVGDYREATEAQRRIGPAADRKEPEQAPATRDEADAETT